ncbi:hypothetical protein BsWGS_06705 [Bradybaena similaris]
MMFEAVLNIAVLLCLVLVVLGCLDCLFKRKRFEAFGIRDSARAQHNAAFSVDIFDADSVSEQVVIEPLPDILSKVATVPVLRPRITCTERGKQEATLSLLSVQRSFPRSRVTYLKEIGSGWFGKAIESEAIHIVAESDASHVVVKMLKDDASKLEQKQFMEEVHAFRCLEHENLLGFLGQCTETSPFLVILEFAAHGNLKSYLVKHRQDVETLIASNRLVSFALGAASGLACLHRHHYIHNDLAARNCLVMSDYTLKIGDYGISDSLFKDEYFNTGSELLPVRWMAPEMLVQSADGVWTSEKCSRTSDMWSFGILLWEICSLGERPYDSLTDDGVLQNVVRDRLVLPSEVNTKLPFKIKMWSVMVQCWEHPSERLQVEQAHNILEQLRIQPDTMAVTSHFDQKWNHLEPNQGKGTNTGLKNTSALANISGDFNLEIPSSFSDELDMSDGIRRDDIILEIDDYLAPVSSSRNLVEFSAPESSMQPILTSANHSLSTAQQNGSFGALPYQFTLENELKTMSTPLSHIRPTTSLDQQITTTSFADSTSKDSISATQFYSPHSSPSSEYVTVDETRSSSSNHAETLKELSFADGDLSLDSEGMSIHESIDDTLKDSFSPGGNSIGNNNNNMSFILHFHEGEEDFSDFVHTSPEDPDINCTDFEPSLPTAGDSLVQAKGVHEDEQCNKDASILRTNIKSFDGFSCTDDIFSELVTYVDSITPVNSDRNEIANIPNSTLPIHVDGLNSISGSSNLSYYINSHGAVANVVEESNELNNLQANPEVKPWSEKSLNIFASAQDQNSVSSEFQVSGLDIENESNLDMVSASPEELPENESDLVNAPSKELSENESNFGMVNTPADELSENQSNLDIVHGHSEELSENVSKLEPMNAAAEELSENESSLDMMNASAEELSENESNFDTVNSAGVQLSENESNLDMVNAAAEEPSENESSLDMMNASAEELSENESNLDTVNSAEVQLSENESNLDMVNAAREQLSENVSNLDMVNAAAEEFTAAVVQPNRDNDQPVVENQQESFSLPSSMCDSIVLINSDNIQIVQSVFPRQSKSSTDSLEDLESINKERLPHMIGIVDGGTESNTSLNFATLDSGQAFSPSEQFQKEIYSDHSEFDQASLMDDDTMVVQEEVSTSSQIESKSVHSNTHSPSLTEAPTNHVTNSTEAGESMLLNDASDNIQETAAGEVSVEDDDEQDEEPSRFQSNLYRCSRINLTEDNENAAETLSNFKSVEVHNDHLREDSQSPVDYETEGTSNNNFESEFDYISEETNSEQPLTSSPDGAVINPDSAARLSPQPASPVDFDEQALQIASEIYLSRGLKSPRVFEIPPLETIPEHPLMPGFQEDSNYTPSDTSSMDVRYEEMFGGDSFEWDDFYGDSIGKDLSLQQTTHQHNSFIREYDVSDWSMDIDSESIASGASIPSQSEETTFSQPTHHPSQSNTSIDTDSSIFINFDSVLSPQSKSADSSRDTLVSSLLSQLQSPIVSSISTANQNKFYSLTERYDLETDSSSDGLPSLAVVTATAARSTSSFTHVTPLSPPASPPLSPLLPFGQKSSEQQSEVSLPVAFEQSISANKSFNEESDVSSEKTNLSPETAVDLLDSSSKIVTASENIYSPVSNMTNEEPSSSEKFQPVMNVSNSNVDVHSESAYVAKHNVLVNSEEAHRDTGVIISAELTENKYIGL